MPIFLVGNEVFRTYKKLDCILCPKKYNENNLYMRYEKTIFDIVGKERLKILFRKAHSYQINVPFITDGFEFARRIMYVIPNEMRESKNFKLDMYNAYDNVFKLAMDNNVAKFIIPCIPYGYKRKGEMHTYRTCFSLCKHLSMLYNPDFTIYILVERQPLLDNIYNYDPYYVSTSFPLSKRHKPLVYPLITSKEIDEFVKDNGHIKPEKKYLLRRNYHVGKVIYRYKKMYKLIKQKFEDDASFCITANLAKSRYILILIGKAKPTKEELIGIAMALNYTLQEATRLLSLEKYRFSDSSFDIIVQTFLDRGVYDVYRLNEKLHSFNLMQVGSYTSFVHGID